MGILTYVKRLFFSCKDIYDYTSDDIFVNEDWGGNFPTDKRIITGNIKYWFRTAKPTVVTLGRLRIVKGNLDVRTATLKDLGDLEEVQGDCYLNGTSIKSLGKLRRVGGKLQLPLQFKYMQEDLAKIRVDGRISFHKDSGRRYMSSTCCRLIKSDLLENADCSVPIVPEGFGDSKTSFSTNQEEFYKKLQSAYKVGRYLDVAGQTGYLIRLVNDEIKLRGTCFTNVPCRKFRYKTHSTEDGSKC